MSVFAAVARPWGPFVVGVVAGLCFSVYGLYDGTWKTRHTVQNPWEYQTEYEKAVESFKRTDWNWGVLCGAPFVGGAIVWCVWFVLSVIAGVGL